MASSEAELEQLLKEAGKQLLHPPDSVDDLLPVLDKVEKLLSKVDQSPKKSMLDALKPSMRALIHDSLSSHSDVDVKVAVASCISEITRITAPDAPYNDDQMRDVFQLIVSSFEGLADQSSRSYNKRASILETVSKVRSCVIMLDLECEGLIVEMFEHFLRSVRDYHLESIYLSMENIMVLVLEESEEISVDLLKPILASVKKDSEGVLPIARKLAEGVLLKSASKVKPYLMPAVESIGDTLDIYTQAVASICEETTATIEHNDENASGVQLANESKSTKGSVDETQQGDESKLTTASSDHTDQVAKEETEDGTTLERSPKSVMSNGVKGDEEASVDQEPPPSKKPLEEDKNEQKLDANEDVDDDESDADVAKPESKPEEKRGTKSDTPVNSGEPSDSSHVEGQTEKEKEEEEEEEAEKQEQEQEPDVVVIPSETEKDETAPESNKEPENVSSPSPSQTDSKKPIRSKKTQTPQKDETVPESPKKSTRTKNKAVASKIPATEDGGAASDSDNDKPLKKPDKKVDTGAKSSKQSGKKGKQQPSKKTDGGKQSKKGEETPKQSGKKGEDSDSDDKPLKVSVNKKGDKSGKENEESDSDSKPLKVSVSKKGNNNNNDKSSSKKKDDGKKRAVGKEKEQSKSLSGDDEMEESSPKSAVKETPGNSSKRKRNTGKDKVKYDKSLVGLKVKVFWPEDKAYYEGVIESFDAVKKKHKVSYVDGDEEILNLKTQKWEILEEFSVRDEEPDTDAQNEDDEEEEEEEEEEASPETHKKKKSKTDPTPSASQEKTKDSSKRGGATSSSSAAKSKGSSKDNKSTPQKSNAKSKEDEETPKSKAVNNKSKGKTPGNAGKAKAGSEDVKTPETTKGGPKTGKKRKKRS